MSSRHILPAATGITASEIKAAGAGLVVPAGDPESLLRAVLELQNDKDAAARFGLNGQRYRESVLDQRTSIEKWASLIAEMPAPHNSTCNFPPRSELGKPHELS
jgi:glycosyltransferase involved in cell wall biosynthesis